MQILAIYGSNYGQAEKVLKRIVGILEGRGHVVSVYKGDTVPADVGVEDFDAVVIAASIAVGRYQDYIKQFVLRHLAVLRTRPTAFISVNGANPESKPEWQAEARRYVEQFRQDTGWEPRWTATFSGALRFRRYGLVTRWIMKMISRQHGGPTDTSQDYEFTDWVAVDRFGADLATELATGPSADLATNPAQSPADRPPERL